jgi:hypothetical protein
MGVLENKINIIKLKLHKSHLLVFDLLSIISKSICHVIQVNVE